MRPKKDVYSNFTGLLLVSFIIISMTMVFFTSFGSSSNRPFSTMTGSSQDDNFGWNVSHAGDINSDGYPDIIVGAPGYDSNRGRVYIFYGGPWFSGTFSADEANVTITGAAQGDFFGWDVSGVGNINEDIFDDFIVGAPGNKSNAGSVYIIFGNNLLPPQIDANNADVIISTNNTGDMLGFSVSDSGDVNNDGYDDVIIGAPKNESERGVAYVFYGMKFMKNKMYVEDANLTIFGENSGDEFGFSVSSAGDINKDNYGDVIIGAPGADKSYLYYGNNMNSWIQTTQAAFDSGTKVHVRTTATEDGEVKLETFYDTKAMMTYFNGSAVNTPKIRTWNQNIWSLQGDANIVGTDENQWFVVKSGTVRKNEKILAVSDNGLDINLQIHDGLSWGPVLELSDVCVDSVYRSYDVAYESQSGDAMIAYYNQSSGDTFPKYRIWNGASWTAELDALNIGTDDIYWLVLASNPNSDEILMVTLNSTNGLWAQVWDGDAWGNAQLLETNSAQTTYQCFDAVYESQSGNGFIAWGANFIDLKYRRWIGNWMEPEGGWGTTSGVINFVKIAAEPNTNYILAAELDDFNEINARVWDGVSWGLPEPISTAPEVNNKRCFDLTWESKSDREGLIVFGENFDYPRYMIVNGTTINTTLLNVTDVNPDVGDPNWVVLESDPQSDNIMLIYSVNDGFGAVDDIGVELWNGSNWTSGQNVELDSTIDNSTRFDLAYTDTSGYLLSQPYDAKVIAPWGKIGWKADVPLGTTLKIRTRTSPDNISWSLWSDWYDNGERISSPDNRYIQYQALFETTNVSLTPTLYEIKIELNHANLTINGTPNESFGWSVAWAGDMDGDALGDIVIGAPQNNSNQGSAYVFTGSYIDSKNNADRLIDLVGGDSANITMTGQTSGDLFGYSVSTAGNFSNNGFMGVIVGAPDASSNGTIYIFFGGPSLLFYIQASNANFTAIGENPDDGFGRSVSWIGNLDDDFLGFEEIIVGAPFYDDNGNTSSGKAYLFHLSHQPDVWINGNQDNLYQEVPSGVQVNISEINPGENSTWWIVIQNDAQLNDTFIIDLTSNMLPSWTWEMRENTTWSKVNDGDFISLSPGEWRNYTLNISSPGTALNGDESYVEITVTSENDTAKKDSVRARARAIDITLPEISDETTATPTTGDLFTINASVTDNVAVGEVHLYYWFELNVGGPDGPYNVTMDPGYTKEITVPGDAIILHYNISARDLSGNWNETGEFVIDVQDNDLPSILDQTIGTPIADDVFTIQAQVNDNIQVDMVFLYYWFDLLGAGIDGPHYVPMDPGYSKIIIIPADAIKLYYNISANDTSNNWAETGDISPDVHEIVPPEISDNTVGTPTTGDSFVIIALATDNFAVYEAHLYFWFDTISGITTPQNVTMNDMGGGIFNYQIDVPENALSFYYNISANDTSNNWNETQEIILEIEDNDMPVISDIVANPSTQEEGGEVNITVNILDSIGVNEVWINISFPDGSFINESMEKAQGDDWYYINAYTDIGDYNYTIWAVDTNGNFNLSGINQFTITPPPPTVDYIQIRTGPDGTGDVLSEAVLDLNEHSILYAAGYNNTYDYIGEVLVNWICTNTDSGSVNPSFGTITNFTAVGLGTGTVWAIFGLVDGSFTFEVVISQEPEIIGTIPDIQLNEDFKTHYIDLSIYAYDPQQPISDLMWYLTGVDRSIIEVAGENQKGRHIITFVSKDNKFGNMLVTYWLFDGENQVSQNAWINITPVNDPPYLSDCPNLIVHYDSPYSFDYTYYIRDVDNPHSELTLSIDDSAYKTVKGFVVTYNYPQSMLGKKVNVKIIVTDGEKNGSKLIEIKITSNNPPRSIGRIPDVSLLENETRLAVFDLDNYFNDPDGDTLRMSVGYTILNITINDDNTVDISAKGEWSGTEKIKFRAMDPMGAIVEQTINVTVIPVNDPPTIQPLPIISVRFELEYIFDLSWYISDNDNEIEELVISTSIPDNITVDGTKLILLFPKEWAGQPFPYTVPLTISVSDGIFNASQSTAVVVDENYPPHMINPLDDIFMYEDESKIGIYDLDDYFLDTEGDTLYYTYGNISIKVTIWEDNTIDFVPPPDWYGSELITIRAIDEKEAFFEDTIKVTVIPVNDPPGITEIPQQEGVRGIEWILDLTDYINDIDNDKDDLVVSVNSSYVTVVGHVLIFKYDDNMKKDTLWITLTDGENETVASVGVLIRPPAALPEDWSWAVYIFIASVVAIFLAVYVERKGIYNVEDLFLITRSGLLIEHAGIKMNYERGEEKDQDILAGMFVAVQEFIRDSFGGEEGEDLKRLDYGDKKVLIHRGNFVILAAFLTGPVIKPYDRKMKTFVGGIEERFADELENWTGSVDAFPDIKTWMEDLLEGKFTLADFDRAVKREEEYVEVEIGKKETEEIDEEDIKEEIEDEYEEEEEEEEPESDYEEEDAEEEYDKKDDEEEDTEKEYDKEEDEHTDEEYDEEEDTEDEFEEGEEDEEDEEYEDEDTGYEIIGQDAEDEYEGNEEGEEGEEGEDEEDETHIMKKKKARMKKINLMKMGKKE